MIEIANYIPEGVRKKISSKNDDELILGAKKIYIQQICGFRGGKKLIEYLEQIHKIEPSDSVDELCTKMNLIDIYYYFTYLFAATQNSNIFYFDRNGEADIHKGSELINIYGQPIWDKPLGKHQKLWVYYKEDKNHVFLAFVSIGAEKRYFDPISQSFNKYIETGIVNCRIHFDNGLIEVTPKHTGEDSIREVLAFIKNKFNITHINPIKINDKDIREFDKKVLQVTHEKREGEEATTTLTRANKEGDTRNDLLREDIKNREFKKEHGLLETEGNIRSIIGLTRGDEGRFQFKSYLEPSKRLLLFHNLKDILRWGDENTSNRTAK